MATRVSPRKPENREIESVSLRDGARTLGDLANTAAYGNRIVPLTRRGKLFAAIIGKKDLERLRQLDASAA